MRLVRALVGRSDGRLDRRFLVSRLALVVWVAAFASLWLSFYVAAALLALSAGLWRIGADGGFGRAGRYRWRVRRLLRPIGRQDLRVRGRHASLKRDADAVAGMELPRALREEHARLAAILRETAAASDRAMDGVVLPEDAAAAVRRSVARREVTARIVGLATSEGEHAYAERLRRLTQEQLDRAERESVQHEARMLAAIAGLQKLRPPAALDAAHQELLERMAVMQQLGTKRRELVNNGDEATAVQVSEELAASYAQTLDLLKTIWRT